MVHLEYETSVCVINAVYLFIFFVNEFVISYCI